MADNISAYGDHLTTGFLGTPYLCFVLSRFGYTDISYRLLLQDSYPSWLYPVKMGAMGVAAGVDFAKTGKKPSGYTDTGVALISAKPVQGVRGIDVKSGTDSCWGK